MSEPVSTLIIPVETQIRELDAKLLLACAAAERGFPVIIGSRAFLHFAVASIPRGVYLAKSMRTISRRMFNILRQLGHEIVAWDEEGLVREADPQYYRWRLSPVTMQQISHLIAWGPDNARSLRNYSGYNGTPIHITGNPRIDLMRPELRNFFKPQADALRQRFGDFVLVNTNFSKVNHFLSNISELKKAVEAKNPAGVNAFDAGKYKHKLALFQHFKEMLPQLCEALPDKTVVLRPHPAEDSTPWFAIADRCSNLKVANDGNVIPWLIAAKVLVANGCMTMLEAAVLDTPAVSYQPVRSQELDDDLPNSLGHRIFKAEDLCAAARDVFSGRLQPLDPSLRRTILDGHMAALDGPLAADRIVDVLEAEKYNRQQPPAAKTSDFFQGWLHTKLRAAVKRFNMRRPGHRNSSVYHAHRFPEISTADIRERIAIMGTLLNRFATIRVEQHSRHIFRISG